MTISNETESLGKISTTFPTIPLKYGVDRQINKFDEVPEKIPRISLDMVESWTGEIIKDDEEDGKASTGLVEFDKGDVLFSKLRPYLAKGFKGEYRGAASPEFLVLQPNKFNADYLLYMLLSKEFIERVDASTYGAKMPRASWDFVGNLQVPCPPKNIQESIVSYLDHRTRKINKLGEDSRQLIQYLDEKKISLIDEVVSRHKSSVSQKLEKRDTTGANQRNPKVRYVSKSITSGPRSWAQYYDESSQAKFIRITNLQANNIKLDLNNLKFVSPPSDSEARRARVKPGDILVSITADIGSVGIVPDGIGEAYVNQHISIVRTSNLALSKWMAYCLSSPRGQYQLLQPVRGGTKAGLGLADIGNVRIPIPPMDRQRTLVQNLEQERKRLEDISSMLELLLKRLDEQRQALITEAVTGQIDLTDWQPPDEQEALA